MQLLSTETRDLDPRVENAAGADVVVEDGVDRRIEVLLRHVVDVHVDHRVALPVRGYDARGHLGVRIPLFRRLQNAKSPKYFENPAK